MERGRAAEAYNVCRGESTPVGAVLDRLVALSGLAVQVRERADLVRGTEPQSVRADGSKLRHETGWAPRYSLDQTLADTLAYWRAQP
jgi:GDP-4-dehydro-6-deoxy-D-mannose reductase